MGCKRIVVLFAFLAACGSTPVPAGPAQGSALAAAPAKPAVSAEPQDDHLAAAQRYEIAWWRAGDAACPDGASLDHGTGGTDPIYYQCITPDGRNHGSVTFFFTGNKKQMEGQYRHGKAQGRWFRWDEDGRLVRVDVFDGDHVVRTYAGNTPGVTEGKPGPASGAERGEK